MNEPDNQIVNQPRTSAVVADDDDEFRQALTEIIELEGWHVWQASNGEEAVDYATRLQPDVLVLDHRMPRLTGVEVVQRLRRKGVQVPVVFVSAAHEVKALASSVGVSCHLRKPFGIEDLVTLMKKALRGQC